MTMAGYLLDYITEAILQNKLNNCETTNIQKPADQHFRLPTSFPAQNESNSDKTVPRSALSES